ncbi:MAG: hypothetical protein K0S09_35 [Sphingobacteriaceae bacterium]|jgi:hypothetical protein|nr:hypothetical protein [Sphingobacteriaceae bacterium]
MSNQAGFAPGTIIKLTTIAGERKWREVNPYKQFLDFHTAGANRVTNEHWQNFEEYANDVTLPDDTNLPEGTECILGKEVRIAKQFENHPGAWFELDEYSPFGCKTRIAIVLKEQPEAEITNHNSMKLYVKDKSTGDIHEVRKYAVSGDGQQGIWCDTWYGHHVIGSDCEFVQQSNTGKEPTGDAHQLLAKYFAGHRIEGDPQLEKLFELDALWTAEYQSNRIALGFEKAKLLANEGIINKVLHPTPDAVKSEPTQVEPPKAEACNHEPLVDTGIGYCHCTACNQGWKYSEYDKAEAGEVEQAKEFLINRLNMTAFQADTLYDGYIAACIEYSDLRLQEYKSQPDPIRERMAEALKHIESVCDNQNPSHEGIWRIAHEALKGGKHGE